MGTCCCQVRSHWSNCPFTVILSDTELQKEDAVLQVSGCSESLGILTGAYDIIHCRECAVIERLCFHGSCGKRLPDCTASERMRKR